MAASISDKITKTFSSVNPNVARVTATRTAGGSSLSCDNLAGWPTDTAVHFSTYQIDTSNAVVSGTQIDWKGIVSGDTIGSLTRLAGATDSGSSVGDVVEMNPTASWANDLATALTAEHNQDGTHGDVTATSVDSSGAVSTDTVSEHTSGSGVTVDGVLIKDGLVQHAGAVQQISYTLSSAAVTGTTQIPIDDTIPQSTEGNELLTVSITPKSATNILVIRAKLFLSHSAANQNIVAALFQDANANALAVDNAFQSTATAVTPLVIEYAMVAGTTSETTFKIRGGTGASGTLTFNGASGARRFGATPKSAIVITEYKAS